MSRYTGKCDLYDTLDMDEESDFSKIKFYIGRNITPLRVNSYKDILPYVTHIVVFSSYCDGNSEIRISNESYLDTMEKDMLQNYMNRLKRYFRSCQRKKIEFKTEDVVNNLFLFSPNERSAEYRLALEVLKDGLKANIPVDVHYKPSDLGRSMLAKDMIDAGYDIPKTLAWCFGLQRYVNKDLPSEFLNIGDQHED